MVCQMRSRVSSGKERRSAEPSPSSSADGPAARRSWDLETRLRKAALRLDRLLDWSGFVFTAAGWSKGRGSANS